MEVSWWARCALPTLLLISGFYPAIWRGYKYLTTKPKELVEAELSYGRTIDKSQEGNDVQLF
jgi:hypothetical protein